MRTLPTKMIRVLAPFAPLFSERVLAARSGAAGGRDPRPGQADRELRPARDGLGPTRSTSIATIGS